MESKNYFRNSNCIFHLGSLVTSQEQPRKRILTTTPNSHNCLGQQEPKCNPSEDKNWLNHCPQPSLASWSLAPSATLPPHSSVESSGQERLFWHLETISTPDLLLCQGLRRHWNSQRRLCTSQTEIGINLQQLLIPSNRNHSLLTNWHNLKASEIIYVFRQSVGARTARAAGNVLPLTETLIPLMLCGQHSYSNLSTTDNLQFQFIGWVFCLIRGLFFVCLWWCFFKEMNKGSLGLFAPSSHMQW